LNAAASVELPPSSPALAEHFERDLDRNLAVLFGRA
jgi:hypothetical protein